MTVRPIIRVAVSIGMLSCCSSCAYLHQRGCDLADAVTLAAETGYANVGVQTGPFLAGAGVTRGRGFGLRSGARGAYGYEEANFLLIGYKSFQPASDPSKGYEFMSGASFLLPLDIAIATGAALGGGADSGLGEAYVSSENNTLDKIGWSQVEGSVCLLGGLRCGVNLGETLDFLVGWATLDPAQDDDKRAERAERIRMN